MLANRHTACLMHANGTGAPNPSLGMNNAAFPYATLPSSRPESDAFTPNQKSVKVFSLLLKHLVSTAHTHRNTQSQGNNLYMQGGATCKHQIFRCNYSKIVFRLGTFPSAVEFKIFFCLELAPVPESASAQLSTRSLSVSVRRGEREIDGQREREREGERRTARHGKETRGGQKAERKNKHGTEVHAGQKWRWRTGV